MAEIDKGFNALCRKIKTKGRAYKDERRDVDRLQIPTHTFEHSFKDGFPAITSKKLFWKGLVCELLWFLRGQTNIFYLLQDNVDIWNKDAWNMYNKFTRENPCNSSTRHMYSYASIGKPKPFSLEEFSYLISNAASFELLTKEFSFGGYTLGDAGKNYSYQWTNFGGSVNQIEEHVKDMKKNIMGSRLVVNAWNAKELDETALPPCHNMFQTVGVPLNKEERTDWMNANKEDIHNTTEFGFILVWDQRSVDTFLGLPFNIASYGLLSKIFEDVTDFPAMGVQGNLKCVHFYDNQYEAVDELLSRDEDKHGACTVRMPGRRGTNTMAEYLEGLTYKDFKLIDYTSDEAIKVDMIAPKEI